MTKRGVVSFCIFGDNPRYLEGGIRQSMLYHGYSLDGPVQWDMRFYLGRSVSKEYVTIFEALGQVVHMDYPEDQTATFWRFGVFEDLSYDYYLIRDTDSRLCPREIAATNQWIESGKDFHLMRDHPFHNVPVLAGLWGATGNVAPNMRSVLPVVPPKDFYLQVNRAINHASYLSNDFYQVDQWWLRWNVHKTMRRSVWVNDSHFKIFDRRRDIRPFPTERGPGEFVGKGYEADGSERYPEHSMMV